VLPFFYGYFSYLNYKMFLDFQLPITSNMDNIINFHHDLMFYLIIILVIVIYLLIISLLLFKRRARVYNNELFEKFINDYTFYSKEKNHYEDFRLEVIWTILPIIFLFFILSPSLLILYSSDIQKGDNCVVLKITGNQWYWEYEYTNLTQLHDTSIEFYSSFDIKHFTVVQSFLIDEENSWWFNPRKNIYLPINSKIKLLFTSNDVAHCWSIPNLGVKSDCIPGRLNEAVLVLRNLGTFHGYCYELCGTYHGFMPIALKVVSVDEFLFFTFFNCFLANQEINPSIINNNYQ